MEEETEMDEEEKEVEEVQAEVEVEVQMATEKDSGEQAVILNLVLLPRRNGAGSRTGLVLRALGRSFRLGDRHRTDQTVPNHRLQTDFSGESPPFEPFNSVELRSATAS
jgi:hypothetical protein